MTGHCSKCHKVWTLEKGQGLCHWCGKQSTCQSSTAKLYHIKSRSNGSKRQALTSGNGYSQLDDEWLTYYKIASRFSHKAKAQDREDSLHDKILTLTNVERNNGHKPFTRASGYRFTTSLTSQRIVFSGHSFLQQLI